MMIMIADKVLKVYIKLQNTDEPYMIKQDESLARLTVIKMADSKVIDVT